MMTIVEIDKRREAIGLSQSQLCHRANLHPTTYVKLKKGQSKIAHFKTLSKLRKAIEHFEEQVT